MSPRSPVCAAFIVIGLVLLSTAAAAAGSTCPSVFGPGKHEVVVQIGAMSRTFYVHVPDHMPEHDPRPALLSWHGCGGNVEPPWPDFEVGTRLNEATALRQWFNIYPVGTASTPGASLGWNWCTGQDGCSSCNVDPATDDVAFARAILEWIPQNLCVDEDKLFAMGFSNGGSMNFRLYCEFSDVFRAISVTGTRLNSAWQPGTDLCPMTAARARRIPVVGFCGSNDSCMNSAATLLSQEQLMAFYGEHLTCASDPYISFRTATTTCKAMAGCGDSGLDLIEFCVINGIGHVWPGSDCCTDRCLGDPCPPAPGDVEASGHLLDFFARLPPLPRVYSNATRLLS
eukprot:SAG31_NODE_5453_length_2531_cov_1.683799_2_plen_342_part_00